jgi:hypothetical protein
MPRAFAASPSIWYYVDGCLDEIGRKKGKRDWEVARLADLPAEWFEFPNSLVGRERFPVRQFHFPVLLRKIPCSTA